MHETVSAGSILDVAVFQVVGSVTFGTRYELAIGWVPCQGIVGASVLIDAVGTLAVVGYDAVEVGLPNDDAVVGSQIGRIGVLLFVGSSNGDVFRLSASVVGSRENVPNAIFVGGTDKGICTIAIEGNLQGVACMVLSLERKLTGEFTADGVLGSAGGKEKRDNHGHKAS